MERGTEFLRTQVSLAVMQHQSFVDALRDHERSADDIRFRDLCTKYIPLMQEHQRMLEQHQQEIGAEAGMGKKILNAVTSVGRDLADVAVQSDYYRLIGDLLMSRQAEDTLKTFREAGRALGMDQLYRIGEMGERHHDDYNREANRLIQQMFVEQVRGVELEDTARADGSARVADELDRRPTI
jgi:hypothetical protein